MSYFRGFLTGVAGILLAHAIQDKNLALIVINTATVIVNICAECIFND